MKSLLIRTVTGFLFVAIIAASVLLSDFSFNIAFNILFNVFLLFTCIALYEYRSLLQRQNIKLSIFFYVVSLSIYFIASYASILWKTVATVAAYKIIILLFLMFGLFFLPFVVELFRKQENPFTHIAYSILGIIWIVLPFSLINHIPFMFDDGKYFLLAIFILVWMYDTFAYCIGSLCGKHRLMERVSPKKSWEGAIGSAVLTLVFAFFLTKIFPFLPLSGLQWVVFALIVVVFGTLGDLVESLFKRQLSVKDSGNILPGHGGVLDRFDSIFFVIPFIILYLIFILL